MTEIEERIVDKAIELIEKGKEITPEIAKAIIQDEIVRQEIIDGENIVFPR